VAIDGRVKKGEGGECSEECTAVHHIVEYVSIFHNKQREWLRDLCNVCVQEKVVTEVILDREPFLIFSRK